MTFEDWLDKNNWRGLYLANVVTPKEIWNAATAAERQRCLDAVKEIASASSIIGIGVAKQIAEKIGE